MKYYSTNRQAPVATLEEAVVKGLAADKGLFMPETIKPLPQEFYDTIETLSFQEIAYRVADAFFGEDVPAETLKQIVYDTLNFDVPLLRKAVELYRHFSSRVQLSFGIGTRLTCDIPQVKPLNIVIKLVAPSASLTVRP